MNQQAVGQALSLCSGVQTAPSSPSSPMPSFPILDINPPNSRTRGNQSRPGGHVSEELFPPLRPLPRLPPPSDWTSLPVSHLASRHWSEPWRGAPAGPHGSESQRRGP